VTLIDDFIDEDNETVIFIMDPPTNATQGPTTQHVLTIADNDDAPFVTFELASQIGMENGGPMTAKVLLSATSSKDVVVNFSYTSSATPGTEFTITASPVTIVAGSTSVDIVITVLDDAIPGEGNERSISPWAPCRMDIMERRSLIRQRIEDNDLCPNLSTRDVNPILEITTLCMACPIDMTQLTIWITDVYIEWNNGTGQKLMQSGLDR
jgi:hypothetical protein